MIFSYPIRNSLPFLFTLLMLQASAQQSTHLADTVFSKNHLEWSLGIEGSKEDVSTRSGQSNFNSVRAFGPSINVNYIVNPSKQWGISLGAGLGTFSNAFEIEGQEFPLAGTSEDGYFSKYNSSSLFFSLSLGARYRHFVRQREFYLFEGGIRLMSFNSGDYINTGSAVLPDSSMIRLWNVNYTFETGIKPFLYSKIGWGRMDKNYNILSFSLFGQYGWSDIHSGSWETYPGTSLAGSGSYSSQGSTLGLSIAYTFTGADNSLKQKALLDKGSRNVQEDLRFDQRSSKRTLQNYVIVYGSLKRDFNSSEDPNDVIGDAWIGSGKVGAVYGKAIAQDQFLEVGISQHAYWEGYSDDFASYGNLAFSALQTDLGWTYSWHRGKRAQNILDFSAGVSAAFNLEKGVTLSGDTAAIGSGLTTTSANDTILAYNSYSFYESTVFPMLYLGISKDVRISDHLYLNLAYRYYQGFITAYEQEFDYRSNRVEGPVSTRIFSRGSHQDFRFGLKYVW